MVRPLSLLTVLLCLVISIPASAQEVRRITFDDAVQIALEQNVALKRSENNLEFSEINMAQARASYLPNLNFNISGGQNYGRNFNQEEARFVTETTTSMNARAQTSVTLFQGLGRLADNKQASYSYDAGEHTYERQKQAVVFNVMSRYLDLLERREQIRIQEENLESQRQQLIQIEEFTNVGSRPISDLYQQQANTANAELNLITAERFYQLAEVGLIQVLQLDPFGSYEFVSPDVSDASLTSQVYNAEEMLREAFGRRSDLKAADNDILAAEQGILFARSGLSPTLSLSFNTGSFYNDRFREQFINPDGSTGIRRVSFSDQLGNQNISSGLSLNLNIPIFNRFQTHNQIQRAKVQYDNAKLDLEELQQSISIDVRQAYLDFLTAEKSLDVTEKQEIAAQQAFTAAQERYNVGAATLVELTQARATLVQAESDRIQSRYDFIFRKQLIEYYLGKLDPSQQLFR